MQATANGASAPQKPPPPQLPTPTHAKPIDVATDRIVSGPNPRKTFDEEKLNELAASLSCKGQQSPILVRPGATNGTFQIVYGERRWRAVKLLGWKTINAFVRELSDGEALEEALTENAQRADVDEYEEAEAFRQLRDQHKRSAEDIAQRVGKSMATVYARLKLAELDSKARELARDKGVPPSTALLAARIPDKGLQFKAVKAFGGEGRFHDNQPMSFREAARHVQQNYMLRLAHAPFDVTDAKLVPAAGACSACPKRTGNQPELFADVAKSDDLCTDPACHKGKTDAVFKLRAEKAKESGQKVMPDSEAKKVFDEHGNIRYGQEYVDVDVATNLTDYKAPRALLKKAKDAPTPILALNPHTGKIVELLPKDVAVKVAREAAPKEKRAAKDSKANDEQKKWKAQQVKEKAEREEEEKSRTAAVHAIIGAVVERVEKKGLTKPILLLLATALLDEACERNRVDILKRRVDIDDQAAEEAFRTSVGKMTEGQLSGLIVEYGLGGSWDAFHSLWRQETDKGFGLACKALGIDQKAIDKRAIADLKKAQAPAAPGAAVCVVPGCGVASKPKKKFCLSHLSKLSDVEQKSIVSRNAKLAAEGKLPGAVKRLPPKAPTKAKAKK